MNEQSLGHIIQRGIYNHIGVHLLLMDVKYRHYRHRPSCI